MLLWRVISFIWHKARVWWRWRWWCTQPPTAPPQTAHQSERRQLHLCSWKGPSPYSTSADHPSVISQVRKLPCPTPMRWLFCPKSTVQMLWFYFYLVCFLFSFAIMVFHDYVCRTKTNKNPTKNKLKSQHRYLVCRGAILFEEIFLGGW